jgi:hypothetical protein
MPIPDCQATMIFLPSDGHVGGGCENRGCRRSLDGEMPADYFSLETEVLKCQP